MEEALRRLDREAMFADRVAIAERIRREVDEVVVAAAEKRVAYIDWTVGNLRVDARAQPVAAAPATSPDGEAARLLVASGRTAEDVLETSPWRVAAPTPRPRVPSAPSKQIVSVHPACSCAEP